MKILICLVSLLLLLPTIAAPNEPPNTKGIITLINEGFAHACPCNGKVYTAGHVVKSRSQGDSDLRKFQWEDGHGNEGKAEGKFRDEYSDLGLLDLKGDSPSYYKIASTVPKEGEKVYWEEFEDKTYLPETRDAKVQYDLAGYIFFDKLPKSGASGSCLLNSAGEVVGIVVWAFYKNGKQFGGAVLLVE